LVDCALGVGGTGADLNAEIGSRGGEALTIVKEGTFPAVTDAQHKGKQKQDSNELHFARLLQKYVHERPIRTRLT